MTIYAIVKQIAEQLKGRLSIDEGKGYSNLYPFSVSVDRHENPVKIFTDPRDKKEYILDYKTEKDRLSQLKKINKIISSYNDEAVSNNKEYLKMIPPDGKVHSATEIGFHKPLNTIPEIPTWGFCVLGTTNKDKIFIDDKKLYELRIKLKDDYQFIAHLNRLLFKYIQIKRVESEKMGTWDSKNIWYKPNQRFHKWFQLQNIDPEDNVINKIGTTDALWAIADDMRARKDEGEFDTYMDAYRWAAKYIKKKGVIITAKKLEKAYSKAKTEGKVG